MAKKRVPKVTALSIDEAYKQKVKALTVDFAKHVLCGWVGEDIAKSHFALLGGDLQPFRIMSAQGDYHGKRQMLWEFTRKALGKDTDNFAQEIGDCKIAGTKVLMSNGRWKNIENVRVGEEVITHLNNVKAVTRTIQKNYTGKLFTIKAKGHYTSVTSTSDHEFISFKDDCPKTSEWKSIESLNIDEDSLLIPFCFQEDQYRMMNYCGKKIMVDKDLATILGWYLAEGGSSSRVLLDGYTSYQKITFNLCIDEEEIADMLIAKIKDVFNVQAVKQTHKEDQNVLLVEIYDIDFSKFIHKLVPDNLYNKKVPTVIFESPFDVKIALLKAWIDGDGHWKKTNVSGCSSSHDLIRDLYHLAISCGLSPKTNYMTQYDHQNVSAGVLTFKNNSFNLLAGKELTDRDYDTTINTRARHIRKSNSGILREIEYINYEEVKDVDVYCLEVEEDHSFIANGYAVHNCVSFSGKNVMEHLQCVQIALAGEPQKFRNMFPPYFYGCSRVFIGGGQMWGDGSSGTWLQAAIKKYGALASDESGVPAYSGGIARQWGGHKGPPQEFVSLGQQHLVKTTAQVTNVDDAANALLNGYPVSVCSDRGFNMKAGSDGFHAPKGSWSHAMTLIGFDDSDSSKGLYFIILNSWGDVHGQLKDFSTGVDMPVGILRVKGQYIDKMLAQEDSFAFSQFDGFPDNSKNLEKALFDIVGLSVRNKP